MPRLTVSTGPTRLPRDDHRSDSARFGGMCLFRGALSAETGTFREVPGPAQSSSGSTRAFTAAAIDSMLSVALSTRNRSGSAAASSR